MKSLSRDYAQSPRLRVENWKRRFPRQIPDQLVAAEALDNGSFIVEGNAVVAVDIGHTDTDHTTCVHVPSIDLVVAGDAIYNGTHPYLVESGRQGLNDWAGGCPQFTSLTGIPIISMNVAPGFLDMPRRVIWIEGTGARRRPPRD